MKKRIFGTLLMGAMLVSSMSTFVSCKDYDDDINSLQTQLNSLSSLLDTKEATINNTLNTIQAQLSSLSSLEATLKGQISDGDAATLAAARQAVADAQAALQAAINTNKSELVAANAAQDAAILEAKTAADQALAQLAQLSSTMQPLVESITQDIAAAQAGLTQVQLDLADLATKYSTLNDDLAKAITDIAELKTAVAGQAAALEAIGGQEGLAQVKADVATLLGNLTTLQGTVNTLNAAQAQTAQDIVGINATLAALQAAQANFADKSALNAVQTDVTNLQGKVDALSGQIDNVINTLIPALAKSLRSLVYMPYLYVDGIETIEYPYLCDTLLKETNANVSTRRRTGITGNASIFNDSRAKTISAIGATLAEKYKLADLSDYVITTPADVEYFGPAWPVEYHMNPSRSNTAWEDVKGWNVRKAEVVTRSDAAGTIAVADKYADGTTLFSNANGILTVGLKVGEPGKLANHATPTEGDGRPGYTYENGKTAATCQYDDIIALQVNSKLNGGNGDTLITSDYAMIYPEKCYVEGLYWTKYQGKLDRTAVDYDEDCNYTLETNHVWCSPVEALGALDPTVYPDIELGYREQDAICLQDYLGVHLVRESKTLAGQTNPICLPFVGVGTDGTKLGQWGLSYEFQLVGYSVDGNTTSDSNYAQFTDADENGVSKTGNIIARNVDENGNILPDESQTSVGREPLVRVLVKRGDRVVLDGYILIHITRETPAKEEVQLVVDNYPEQETTFDLCNGADVFGRTTWSQFSYYVLTDKLENMTKDDFDALYGWTTYSSTTYNGVPDLRSDATIWNVAGEYRFEGVQLFSDTDGTKSDLGKVTYYQDANGTTNHTFKWELTADELEELTHDCELPVTKTAYIRYTGRTGAKYKYIYVEMKIKLDREKIAESGIKEKNDNYWYAESGADNGWDAVVWNPWFPENGGNTRTYQQYLVSTFVENSVQFTNTNGLVSGVNSATGTDKAKFYFVPEQFEITTLKGETYIITPRSAYNDETWNAFVCKYEDEWATDPDKTNLHAPATYTTHKWGTDAENKELHEKCAIDYTAGVYANSKLYAVLKGTENSASAVYHHIATLGQAINSGMMQLEWRTPDDDVTKEVLNAVGYYDENHSNILDELHTKVGVVAQNGCDAAVNITDGIFYVSWQRPINVVTEATPMVDAKNNGDYIYTVDIVKIYDWRGPVKGYMWDDNQWLWAYYNVKGIKIDTTPENVLTNMHQTDPNNFVKLNTITTMAQLGVVDQSGTPHIGQEWTMNFNLAAYNHVSMNDALKTYMGIDPESNAQKVLFAGGLYYENNGDNVTTFKVKVPVTIIYEWGEFPTMVEITINRTLGN